MSARTRTRWGWYRLADRFASALVASSGVGRGDLVLDLGAGDGVITRRLVESGARVIAFELHVGRATALRASVADTPAVKVVRADVRDLRLPRRPFHVVSNPPFDGVSRVIERLTSPHSRMVRGSLVTPRSVAARWVDRLDRSPHGWTASVSHRLPRSAFTPRPRVDCCVLVIERRSRHR
ncbi:MAG: rRNA adenine N-6-methyltransferase family protein [Actinomycetota bacterium]